MIIFCWILIVLRLINFGYLVAKFHPGKIGESLGEMIVLTPLIGRVLGWW